MTRLAISDLTAASVEVDLWGTAFSAVPITRSRQKRLLELQKELDAIEDGAHDANDQAVSVLAEMLDQQLAPIGENDALASGVIVEKWQADELTVDQLVGFQERLVEAVRPT